MAKNSGRRDKNDRMPGHNKLDDDVDALFILPLAEFIGARKTLAAELKKEGHADEADHVKTLTKPSVSAWTVNQLYWKHRESFDELLDSSQRLRLAQISGKVGDMQEALEARREVLSHLSDLATTLLQDAGHSPTLETLRRIITTLEAMSTYSLLPDGPTPGRLTQDVDPPGFESLASLMPGSGKTVRTEPPTGNRSGRSATMPRQKATLAREASLIKETRQARIAAAKAAVQKAKRLLTDARAKVQSLEAAQKKADAEAKEAEKNKREAEQRLKKASAAAEEAAERAQSLKVELRAATEASEDAKRSVDRASRELETLFREAR